MTFDELCSSWLSRVCLKFVRSLTHESQQPGARRVVPQGAITHLYTRPSYRHFFSWLIRQLGVVCRGVTNSDSILFSFIKGLSIRHKKVEMITKTCLWTDAQYAWIYDQEMRLKESWNSEVCCHFERRVIASEHGRTCLTQQVVSCCQPYPRLSIYSKLIVFNWIFFIPKRGG